MFNLIMTTRQVESKETIRFLESLKSQPKSVKDNITLIAVIQQKEELPIELDVYKVKALHVEPCSLSKARNIGIEAIEDQRGIVAFPDDDCWYNDKILPKAQEILDDGIYDFVSLGIYDPLKNLEFGRNRKLNEICEIDEQNVLVKPISVSIFYKFSEKQEIPRFDELFGVGTPWGSGEETDFLLNLMHAGKKGLINTTETVYHECAREKDFDAKVTYKYSVGFAAMMIKSKLLRGQNLAFKMYKKLKLRAFVAIFYFFFNGKKRKNYVARIKGFIRGEKEGRAYYKKMVKNG